jgi:hypothetical protein
MRQQKTAFRRKMANHVEELTACSIMRCQKHQNDPTYQLPITQQVDIYSGRLGEKMQDKAGKQVYYRAYILSTDV